MNETESYWVERFYTHFLGRDVCYLFSGGLFISVLEYAYWGKIFFPNGLFLEVVGFLLASYFVGIAISIFGFISKIHGATSVPQGYLNDLCFEQALIKNYDQKVLNHFERYVFMADAEYCAGLSSFLGGILMIILALIRFILNNETNTVEYKLLAFFLVVFGFFMIYDHRTWVNIINSTRQDFAKEIATKEQK